VPVHCCGEDSMSDLSTTLLMASISLPNTSTLNEWQQRSLRVQIRSGWYPYDVQKADQFWSQTFDTHGFFGLVEFFNLHSTNWSLVSGSYCVICSLLGNNHKPQALAR
jgi:hypothetical protein